MDNLPKVQRILGRATVLLYPYLATWSTESILRELQANDVLLLADVQVIKSIETPGDKVQKLLEILQVKPESAYIGFMEALKTEREDLYDSMKTLEEECNYTPSKDF